MPYIRRFPRKGKGPKIQKVPKEKSLSDLKKDLQTVFNAYIRKRDTLFDRAGQPFFICISCNTPKPMNQMNAGHFHAVGGNDAVRYDEHNVNGQCIYCNKFCHGNKEGYVRGMLKKWGQKVIDDLELRRHNRSKMQKFEVQLLIDHYKNLLKSTK